MVVMASVLLAGSATHALAMSPEEEIARLDRVRQNLFEELVKSRAEAAAARAELKAASEARDQIQAELARLKQESAPSAQAPATDKVPATAAISHGGETQASSGVASGTSKILAHAPKPARARTAMKHPTAKRVSNSVANRSGSAADATGLPSVLRLQDPQ